MQTVIIITNSQEAFYLRKTGPIRKLVNHFEKF